MDQELDTSQRILVESEQLFFRYGVKSITMDEIAARIGAAIRRGIDIRMDERLR